MAEAVRERAVSARELAEASLELAAADRTGAVWLLTEERARREADAVDRAVASGDDPGPLAGVPVGWKDLIDTAGIRTTFGSAVYRDRVPDRDADVVERHTAAGAVTVAKLATHELAWGTTTQNPHFGDCRNPYDTSRVPGGSSGGSAAALAARLVGLAPGTDTGGSIRCPASCCGVVGLKPTFGRVSLAGINPLCISLDHCGPMARSVRDCARSLEIMAGDSPRDPRTPPVAVDAYREALTAGVAGKVVGVPERYFFEHTAPDIADRVRAALDVLVAAGARTVEFDLGWPVEGEPGGGFYVTEQTVAVGGAWPEHADEFGADVIAGMRAAERVSGIEAAATGLVELDYRARLGEQARAAGIDLVVTPSQAFPPPHAGVDDVPFAGRPAVPVTVAMCGLTEVFNVLGWPAISLPCGLDGNGLPVGAQIAALPWREFDCLAAAAVVEQALGPLPPP